MTNYDSVNLGLGLLEDLKKKNKTENICEGCSMYKQFGKKCWFYWQEKKFCSQHTENGFD